MSSIFDPEFKRYSEDRVSSRSLEGAHENPAFWIFRLRWPVDSRHSNARNIYFVYPIDPVLMETVHKLVIFNFSLKPETEFRTETRFLEIGV